MIIFFQSYLIESLHKIMMTKSSNESILSLMDHDHSPYISITLESFMYFICMKHMVLQSTLNMLS